MLRFVVRLIRNLLCVLVLPFWACARWLGRPKGRWVVVRLKARIIEARQPIPWLQQLITGSALARTSSLTSIRRLVDHAVDERGLEGVAFVLPRCNAGWAVCEGLRNEIVRLKQKGKKTSVMLSHGGGHRELFIASGADQVFVAPQGTISLLGLSAQARYVKPLLDKIGVEVEPFARKEFKTAAERVSRDSMSDKQREQLQAIIETQTTRLLQALVERTGTDTEQARALFEHGIFRGQEAIDAKLADRLAYEDELPDLLGCDKKHPLVEGARYLKYKEARLFRPLRPQPYLAVVTVRGAISESGAPAGRRASVVSALRHARQDPRAKGVLLWVDSPGGSAEASDLIHREVVRVKEKKPVVAYFGEVAASGGYYVAAHSDAIIAQPLTLTGSIGVVSARMVAEQLLDRVGIRTEVLRSGPHADMYSAHRALSDEERGVINRELDAFYDSFVSLVADGRDRSVDDIEPLARGRVWLGIDAHRHGLVDELGGMDAALSNLRERTGLPAAAQQQLKPMVVSSFRIEPPPPSAQGWFEQSVLGSLKDLAFLATEGGNVLYHVVSLPKIR